VARRSRRGESSKPEVSLLATRARRRSLTRCWQTSGHNGQRVGNVGAAPLQPACASPIRRRVPSSSHRARRAHTPATRRGALTPAAHRKPWRSAGSACPHARTARDLGVVVQLRRLTFQLRCRTSMIELSHTDAAASQPCIVSSVITSIAAIRARHDLRGETRLEFPSHMHAHALRIHQSCNARHEVLHTSQISLHRVIVGTPRAHYRNQSTISGAARPPATDSACPETNSERGFVLHAVQPAVIKRPEATCSGLRGTTSALGTVLQGTALWTVSCETVSCGAARANRRSHSGTSVQLSLSLPKQSGKDTFDA
jgi:hypothetical protein